MGSEPENSHIYGPTKTTDMHRSSRKSIDIYDYFIEDCLRELAKMPLEHQLKELCSLRVLVLDYCGMISKCLCKFNNCDIFLLDESNEDVRNVVARYEAVYILMYELQPVFAAFPCIKVICSKNKISRTEFSGKGPS